MAIRGLLSFEYLGRRVKYCRMTNISLRVVFASGPGRVTRVRGTGLLARLACLHKHYSAGCQPGKVCKSPPTHPEEGASRRLECRAAGPQRCVPPFPGNQIYIRFPFYSLYCCDILCGVELVFRGSSRRQAPQRWWLPRRRRKKHIR